MFVGYWTRGCELIVDLSERLSCSIVCIYFSSLPVGGLPNSVSRCGSSVWNPNGFVNAYLDWFRKIDAQIQFKINQSYLPQIIEYTKEKFNYFVNVKRPNKLLSNQIV